LRYVFANCELDTERRELRCEREITPVAPQVFDLLDYLIRNRDRVVSKDDLIKTIWSGRSVTDAALTTRLNVARKAIGDSGEVGLVVHDQTSRTGIDRRDGFLNEMKAKHPNIKIVSVQYGGGDHLKSAEIAKTMIQANPNLKGIFGANEGSAEGAAIGVKESGKKLVLIGYDSGKEQKEDINSGLMAGAITQNPVGIGKCVVDSAVKALKGEKLPKKVDTGFYWYDKSNMSDPKIAAVLYD